MEPSKAYIPGDIPDQTYPLARYLPLVPDGVVKSWLDQLKIVRNGSGQDWILDAFGSSPQLVLEAARAGFRVLTTANNPIARFLIEIVAKPPTQKELRAALADLAIETKGDQRIEDHIQSLYITECKKCGRPIPAEAFIWERGAASPSSRIYRCSYCGDTGEYSSTPFDVDRASQHGSRGLHWARALERVASIDDPDRIHVEEALATYPPRAVYALITLINKAEGHSATQRRLLDILLLLAFDQTNTLWPHPTARARPRQLTIPPRYLEHNVWISLEHAVDSWTHLMPETTNPVPLAIWPELPDEGGGICLFEGRLKDLVDIFRLEKPSGVRSFAACLAALPRPNQAFWTLSALWSGWLWGKTAAAPFKNVIRRHRYDWAWHSNALHSAFTNLSTILEPQTPILGVLSEVEPGFLSAALVAADMAWLHLAGLSLRAEFSQAQIHWESPKSQETPLSRQGENDLKQQIQKIIPRAAQAYLIQRAEPANYIHLHAVALSRMADMHTFKKTVEIDPAEVVSDLHNSLQLALSYRGGFVRYGGSEHSLEVGGWWIKDLPSGMPPPLSDQIEIELVRYIQKFPGVKFEQIDRELCQKFTGLFTPRTDLISACLDSYAEQSPPGSGAWMLRSHEAPQMRRNDLASIKDLLMVIGTSLDYQVNADSERIIVWSDRSVDPDSDEERDHRNIRYVFYITPSAVLGPIVYSNQYDPTKCILLIPGGRTTLVSYKIRANPFLEAKIDLGWRIVKFRHIRRLAEDPHLSRGSFDDQLTLDPLLNRDPQLPLL